MSRLFNPIISYRELIMSLNKFETELISQWLSDMHENDAKYIEPTIDVPTANLIKTACKTLKQDTHVFVMAIEILEDYILKKDLIDETVDDPALTIAAVIFIASKYMGEQDLKVHYIESFLKKITDCQYSYNSIKMHEMEILTKLDNNLPITNAVDDLNTFIVQFERDMKIKASIMPVCLEVLELVFMTKTVWFFNLKKLYNIHSEALRVFKNLIKNRMFLPIGILVFVFKHTAYKNSLDIDSILDELAGKCSVHVDHINQLVQNINTSFAEI